MVYFTISGCKNCQQLAHVAYIADYLSQNLPNFTFEIISTEFLQWQNWLGHLNVDNGWTHIDSPIIWKNLYYGNRKKILIGGISDFWEYICEYYHLTSCMTENQLKNLVKDSKQFDQRYQKQNMP